MKKSLALALSLSLVGGLYATAMTTSVSAQNLKSHETEVTVFKFVDGKFSGRVAGKRYLCLENQSVAIMKKTSLGPVKILEANLNVGSTVWQNFGEAKFVSAKHPALSIVNRRKRNRALHGEYFAKYVGGPAASYDYGAGQCLDSKSDPLEI